MWGGVNFFGTRPTDGIRNQGVARKIPPEFPEPNNEPILRQSPDPTKSLPTSDSGYRKS